MPTNNELTIPNIRFVFLCLKQAVSSTGHEVGVCGMRAFQR